MKSKEKTRTKKKLYSFKIKNNYQNNIIKYNMNFRTKTNYYINEENEKSIELDNINNIYKNVNSSNNLNLLKNFENKKNFKTESIPRKENSQDKKRKILIRSSLSKSSKVLNKKLSLSKKNKNKLSISLFSINNVNNKINFKQKKIIEHNLQNEKGNILDINSSKNNSNLIGDNENNLNQKSFKLISIDNSNSDLHLISDNYSNIRNEINHKFLDLRHRSYDTLLKKNEKCETIKNNGITKYIKVNKKDINQKNKIINENNTISQEIEDNINYNFNKKFHYMKKLNKNNSQKLITHNNNLYDYDDKINQHKTIKNIFDINNLENNNSINNIFLDKEYQNRFKQKTKSKELNNEIFTEKKQKEYNTIVVKKKSNNYLNVPTTISTTNSSNSSGYNNNNNKKNWVHRLYDEEIKRQKERDKMIYLLRKSILKKPSSKTHQKVEGENKINTIENYKNKYDENFNIINLFLSDQKKEKVKKNNNRQFKAVNNNLISTNNKLIKNNRRRNNLKSKKSRGKFLFLYNEELINEEDEEKEKDEDEK